MFRNLTSTSSSEDNFLMAWQSQNTLRQFLAIFKGDTVDMSVWMLKNFEKKANTDPKITRVQHIISENIQQN